MMMNSQTATARRLSLAFFLLHMAATADAFQAITQSSSSSSTTLPLSQQRRLMPTIHYSHAVVPLWQQQRQTNPASAIFSPTLLCSSSSGSESSDTPAEAETKLQKKIAARKQRVEIGYKIVALAYALVSCISFVKYRFIEPCPIPLMLYITAGPWMASSVAFHLIGSGKNDVLKSGASKRLNLALAMFGFIGLLAKGIITTAQPLWIFACLLATINSIKGYGYGLKGWDLKMTEGNGGAFQDIVGGGLDSLRSLFALPSLFSRSAGYAAMTVTFGAMKVAAVYKIIMHAYTGGFPMNKMVWIPLAFQYKKMLLLTTAAFTLKETVDLESPKGWGAASVGLGLATAVATGAMAGKESTDTILYI